MIKPISGFSKLDKEAKIAWLAKTYTSNPEETAQVLADYWNADARYSSSMTSL